LFYVVSQGIISNGDVDGNPKATVFATNGTKFLAFYYYACFRTCVRRYIRDKSGKMLKRSLSSFDESELQKLL